MREFPTGATAESDLPVYVIDNLYFSNLSYYELKVAGALK
jgi:hypothetical protein